MWAALRILAGLTALLVGPPCAAASDTAVMERIERAFATWLRDNDVTGGALAITRGGDLVRVFGQGGDALRPMDMASLGKAVTAICLKGLIDEGRLSWDDRLVDLLGPAYPKMTDLVRHVTLADLVTHASGLAPDDTQGTMPAWLGDPVPRHAEATARALGRGGQTGRRGTYHYNNENYAILGEVIARTTGRPYREVCQQRVLPSVDYPSATVSPVAGAFDAWGGWRMSVADYARFHARHFGPGSVIATTPAQFPHVRIDGPVAYGLGTVWRTFRDGHNFWHFGALCFDRVGAGAYAVIWQGEWGVVAAWSACADFESMFALDAALARAVFAP